MALILLTFLSMTLEIKLPEEVASVSCLVKTRDSFILLDSVNQTLWRVTPEGNATLFYDRKGSGPGEYSRLFGLRYFDNRLFLIDLGGHKFIVLDEGSVFEKEIRVSSFARDVLSLSGKLFLVHPTGPNMIHLYGDNKDEGLFGSTLNDRRLFGFESGQVMAHNGNIVYVHHFLPRVEVYSLGGELLSQKTLPGFENHALVERKNDGRGSQPKLRFIIKDLGFVENKVFVKLIDLERGEAWGYVYEPGQNRFRERIELPWNTVCDGAGRLIEVIEDQSSGIITLKQIALMKIENEVD